MRLFNQSPLITLSIFIALFFTNVATQAQSIYSGEISPECGSEPTLLDINHLQGCQSEITNFQIDYSRTTPNQVPVAIHVVRKDDGTGGLTSSQVNSILANINGTYASANIELVACNTTDFIDNTQYFYFGQTEESAMAAAYDVPGALNIYFVGTLQSTSGSFLCGYTYFPQSNKDLLIVANNCATSGSTVVHELGHYFGLYHTHGKTNGGASDELNDGSNCIFGGDDVCDTPADPNLSGQVTSNCDYIGTSVDANGMAYDPDTDNIMSYAPTACRIAFTDGQLQRMAYINETERSHLNCNGLTADFTVSQTVGHCGQNMTIDFDYTGGNATTWQWDINNDGIIDYTSQNVTHTYTQDGEFEVSLTVSDGTISLTKVFPIVIKRLNTHTGLFSDDFDGNLANWGIVDEDMGNRWDRIQNYQYSGNSIMCINNFTNNQTGELDYLTSKNIDLSTMVNPSLEFNLSYQPKSANDSDILRVEISNDCGATYDVIYEKTGMDLSTTGSTSFFKWFPQSSSDWRLETINLAAYANETVHIRFVNQSNKSNYLYIDDVNVLEGSALPVEWEAIAVSADRGGALIDWSVSAMSNHSHFEIEQSTDGVTFERIGLIDEINFDGNYQWLDTDMQNGLNYYRIKQVDLDGAIDYSKIVSLENDSTIEVSIYPTLAKDELFIKSAAQATHTEYTIFDVSGKVIQKGLIQSRANIDVNTLDEGIYWISIQMDNQTNTLRFVKI